MHIIQNIPIEMDTSYLHPPWGSTFEITGAKQGAVTILF